MAKRVPRVDTITNIHKDIGYCYLGQSFEKRTIKGTVPAGGGTDLILLQPRRNTKAAKRFFCKLLGKEGCIPRVIITDKLASYKAGLRKLGLSLDHRRHKSLNNRLEGSHQHVRKQERVKRRFRNPINCQKFLSLSLTLRTFFGRIAHKLTAKAQKEYKQQAFNIWLQTTSTQYSCI